MAYGIIDLNSIISKYFYGHIKGDPNIDPNNKDLSANAYLEFPYNYEPSILAENMVDYIFSSFTDIESKYGIKLDSCIICADTTRSEIRKKLYPNYKSGRDDEAIAIRTLRQAIVKEAIIKINERRTDWPMLYVNGFEGDDCCYIAAKVILKGQICYVLSNDGDLLQLIDKYVSVIQYKENKEYILINLQNISEKTNIDGLGYENSKEYILGKILQGDTSDNITGFKGVGKTSALKLVKKYGTFANMIAGSPIRNDIKIRGEDKILQTLKDNQHLYDIYYKIIDISYVGKQPYFQQACIEMFNSQV